MFTSPGLRLIRRHTYETHQQLMYWMFFYLRMQKHLQETVMKADFNQPQTIFTPKDNYSSAATYSWSTSHKLFSQRHHHHPGPPPKRGDIRKTDGGYRQKHLDWGMVKGVKREEKVSSVSGQTEHTSFCSRLVRDDDFGCQMMGGIDVVWNFSTICNNDLFSEATSCQVITFLRWKWTIFWHG